ncbi:hypothetical protein, partial [Acidovorax sp. SD340]|uniref:hypothetical protein n=1 Tax=Acidovorax sp. SD340 TaxID=1690268 RepID=UPI001A96D8CD
PVGHHALGAAQGASKATKTKIDAALCARCLYVGARCARRHHTPPSHAELTALAYSCPQIGPPILR